MIISQIISRWFIEICGRFASIKTTWQRSFLLRCQLIMDMRLIILKLLPRKIGTSWGKPESPLFMWKKPGFLQLLYEINPLIVVMDREPGLCRGALGKATWRAWAGGFFTVPNKQNWMKGTFAGHPFWLRKEVGWFFEMFQPIKTPWNM